MILSRTKQGRRSGANPLNHELARRCGGLEEAHLLEGLSAAKVNDGFPRAQRITWHTLRHTFASRLVMAGVDLATIQKLMGHSNITTTMRYAHLARPHIEESVLVLDPKLHFSCTCPEGAAGKAAS